MKIGLMSDIHLEFGDYTGDFPEVDVLVLAGDITTAKGFKDTDTPLAVTTRDFFRKAKQAATNVMYIPGNHEFYGGEYHKTLKQYKEFCYNNDIIPLHHNEVWVGEQCFLGHTLWTRPDTPVEEVRVGGGLTDYRKIKIKTDTGYRKLQVRDTVALHNTAVNFLFKEATTGAVIVTHHMPAKACIAPRFKNDKMNCGFVTDLTNKIATYQPRLWLHGHTHDPVDVMVWDTRIVCNPRGYVGYENVEGYKPITCEI